MDSFSRKKRKRTFLIILIICRLITHDGVFINVRRPQPKKQPPEVREAIRRTWKRGQKRVPYK